MAWLLIIGFLLAIAALAATLAAAALRPTKRTVRAATTALLALPAFVVLVVIITLYRKLTPSTISALNSGVNERRRRGFLFATVSMMGILSGASRLMVDVRQTGAGPMWS